METGVLLDEVKQAPTLMDVEKEIEYINKLVSFTTYQLKGCCEELIQILDVLSESHENDGYLEVTEVNKNVFLPFAVWIEQLSNIGASFEALKEDLEAYAHTFRLLPWEIYE